MKIAVIGFRRDEAKLKDIASWIGGEIFFWSKNIFKEVWGGEGIVALMPTGIIIRAIAPLIESKWTDTPVVAIDKNMMYSIPLLGGHHGANEMALKLSEFGLIPVITTSMEFYEGLSVGIGCNKGVSKEEILDALKNGLDEIGKGLKDVRVIATTDLKKDERGLIEAVDQLKKPLIFLRKEEINSMDVKESKARLIGLKSVSDACALYFGEELMLPKKAYGGVTIAIAR